MLALPCPACPAGHHLGVLVSQSVSQSVWLPRIQRRHISRPGIVGPVEIEAAGPRPWEGPARPCSKTPQSAAPQKQRGREPQRNFNRPVPHTLQSSYRLTSPVYPGRIDGISLVCVDCGLTAVAALVALAGCSKSCRKKGVMRCSSTTERMHVCCTPDRGGVPQSVYSLCVRDLQGWAGGGGERAAAQHGKQCLSFRMDA